MGASIIGIWSIPDEVLRKIFSYLQPKSILTTVVDVSCRWRSIVESDICFWKNLQIVILCDQFINRRHLVYNNYYHCDVEIHVGEKDLHKVSNAQRLKLMGDSKTTIRPALFVIRILDIVSKICTDIKKVETLHCFGATSKEFVKFLNTRYNALSEISFGVTAVWRIPYEELALFQNLSTLISHDYKFKSHDIHILADECIKLNSLWILFSRSVKNDDIIHFFEKKKDILQEIGLGSSINDKALGEVINCKRLNVLFIRDARYITGESLRKITNLPSLKYISLHRLKCEPEVILNWSLTSTVPPQLKILDLTDCYHLNSSAQNQILEICNVTTCNNVDCAVNELRRYTNPRVHWMYYNVLNY